MRFRYGQVAVGASALPLSESVGDVEDLVLKALPANTTVVYVGDEDVTTNTGWPLSAGEELVIGPQLAQVGLPTRADEIYVIGTAGARVAWLATPR